MSRGRNHGSGALGSIAWPGRRRAALAGDETLPATFDVDAMCKDLRMTRAEAAARDLCLPVAMRTLTVLECARAWGLGDRDCAYVPAFWARTGGEGLVMAQGDDAETGRLAARLAPTGHPVWV